MRLLFLSIIMICMYGQAHAQIELRTDYMVCRVGWILHRLRHGRNKKHGYSARWNRQSFAILFR
jgi:hypothetical protein